VPDKANEPAAIPVLLARLAARDRLRDALVSIDAITTNATIAQAIRDAGADGLVAAKANQPGLRAEVEASFTAASSSAPPASCARSIGWRARAASRATRWPSAVGVTVLSLPS
jgi:predicted transposase YbfD/YdcC